MLRVDIGSAYEKAAYLSELFVFAKDNFREIFGNEYLVTKAIPKAAERCKALESNEWEYIRSFDFFHCQILPFIL